MRVLFLLLLLTSCSFEKKSGTTFSGVAMTMPYRILIGTPLSKIQKKNAASLIADTFQEIDAIYNNWNPHSEISYLNRLPAGEKATLSPPLAHFLSLVDEIVHLTGGYFDPSIEPLQKLWKKHLQEGTVPENTSLEALYPAIGWDKIHREERLFWKEHSLASIDLSGVAKGYCVDLLIQRLKNAGYKNLYVEWGGEIKASGTHPENRKWRIGIRGIENFEIEIEDQALATSGNYLQSWTVGGASYTHIIDPHSKKPLPIDKQRPMSISVMCQECMYADAFATALMLLPTAEEALFFAENTLKVQTWIIDNASWRDPFLFSSPALQVLSACRSVSFPCLCQS